MTTTNKSLTNINYFPTKQMFENNLSGITSNEISFIKITDASIVDKLLGQNGYIKYSNGLIIQWGWYPQSNGSGSSAAFSFPISFPHKCFVCDTCEMIKDNFSSSLDVYFSFSYIRNPIEGEGVTKASYGLGDDWDINGTGTKNCVGMIAIGY